MVLPNAFFLSSAGTAYRQSSLRWLYGKPDWRTVFYLGGALAKRAAIMIGRYTHAHQFKRARRQLKFLRTRLGRLIRDICRKIDGDTVLEARFGPLLG
jgi:hypothetical protein